MIMLHRAAIFLVISTMACGSSSATLGYSLVKTPGGTRVKITCASRSILFPAEWKQVNNGDPGAAVIMELKKNEGTACLVACSPISPGTSLKEYTLEKFTKITARMIRSGFTVSSVKNDVVNEITPVAAADPSRVSGFAYELKAPPHLKSRQVLAISLFLKHRDRILAISFEMEPKMYPAMKKELRDIIGSLK